jgi:hypothetical protein
MKKWQFLLITGICGCVLPGLVQAQEGTMSADPNPCRIEPGESTCTSFIRWDTRGVERAKVFVTAAGRRREVEHEFSTMVACETRRCRAPWISPDTTYTFELFDYTPGDRGRLLASITVTAEAGREAWGTITADPNPCRIRRDEPNCTASISWETRGVERARVFVTAEGRNRAEEKEFSTEANCEPGRCRATWISPETRYTFQLVDFSRGDRGRVLASVTVRAEDRR